MGRLALLPLALVLVFSSAFQGGSSYVLVIGGMHNSTGPSAETLSLEEGEPQCPDPPPLPAHAFGASAAVINGVPTVCGGLDEDFDYVTKCSQFKDGEWTDAPFSLEESKFFAASLVLPNGTWIIMGGFDSPKTTVAVTDGEMRRGPDLPRPMGFHCAANINATHVFVADGDAAHALETETWEWTHLRSFAVVEKDEEKYANTPECGRYGDHDVVVVRNKVTEILDTKSMLWRDGPAFPGKHGVRYAEVVQVGETFVVVGGTASPTVWAFDGTVYEQEAWVEKEEAGLEVPRDSHAAMEIKECL